MYLHWLINFGPNAVAGNPSCGNLPRLRQRIGLDGIGIAVLSTGSDLKDLDRTQDALGKTEGTGNRPQWLEGMAKPSWFCAHLVA